MTTLAKRLKIVAAKLDEEGSLLLVQTSDYHWLDEAIIAAERAKQLERALIKLDTWLAIVERKCSCRFTQTGAMGQREAVRALLPKKKKP